MESALGLGSLSVLVADDNGHMRAIVTEILRSVGIVNIKEARNGAEALGVLRDWQADVAIVDFRMEPIDGVEFTRKIRSQPEKGGNPYLPIVMLTGYADRSRVMEARDAGVTELVVKPITAQAVIARINAVIYHPRAFIRANSYFGPDRRRTNAAAYSGVERRVRSAELQLSA